MHHRHQVVCVGGGLKTSGYPFRRHFAKLMSGSRLYGGGGVRSGGRNDGAGKPTGPREPIYAYIAVRSSTDVSRRLHQGMGARACEFFARASHPSKGIA